MEYILAIDQGTHASRALVLNSHGRVVSHSRHPIPLSRPQPGWVEQEAELIVQSVEHTVAESLRALTTRQREQLAACGITTQRSTVLGWRGNGTPISAAINWQDTRGAAQLAALQSHAGMIRKISGLPLSPHYGASKLHWLHQLHTDIQDLKLGPLSSFLLYRLTNERLFAVDHSNAQRMQLFDFRSLNWSPQLADWFDVPLRTLPACRPVRHPYGSLTSCDIPLTAVCGDQNAAWSGSGRLAQGTALLNLGSGAFILIGTNGGTVETGLLSGIAYSDRHHCRYLSEGTVNGAGNALQWLNEHRQVKNIQSRLGQWLEQVGQPPIFLNTVGGLGSPWWREDLEPGFVQDSAQFSDAELAASVAESIVFLLQYNLEQLQKHQQVRRLRVSGGLSQVDALCRKLANLSGLCVERANDPEASARGVAWLAAGCPESWEAAGDVQFFQPAPDTGLTTRYRLFIEQLEHYIETGHHD